MVRFILVSIMFVVVAGCRSTSPRSTTGGPKDPVQSGGPATEPAAGTPRPSGCTKDLNEFGNPSQCDCATGTSYHNVVGQCVPKDRVCTLSLIRMIHPTSKKCFTAKDGCVAGDLQAVGWRAATANDGCR